MHVPEWLVTPYDMKIYNKGHESDLEDGLIKMHVNVGAKALFKSKHLSEYYSNINTVTKYRKVRGQGQSSSRTLLTCIPNFIHS